jgi:DNA-binding CsgD family transcriptional regulator/tetratricopeptide (TPR) repeat protein
MRPLHSCIGAGDTSPDLSAAVAVARAAWLRADFDACLQALEAFNLCKGDTAHRAEGILLHGRALLRMHRPADAERFLRSAVGTFHSVDGECTARMLHAVAVTLCDSPDAGLALLEKVAERAQRFAAHRAIGAEIAYYRALGNWTKRDLPAAAGFARAVEQAGLDVLAVRATLLLGFIAVAQERYLEGLETFRRALAAYRACRERDPNLAEQILVQLATLEAQLRSAAVSGSHREVSARRVPGDVFRAPASLERCQVAWLDAWQYANDGDARGALHCMREAESVAPAPAARVFALAGRAAISAAFGEIENAREHALYAARIAEDVDWQATHGEERFALVLLAEVLAPLDAAAAVRVLERFDAITSKLDDVHAAGTDPRKTALSAYVRGLVARRCGQSRRAHALLDEAYRGFRACGHLWRAVLALIELDAASLEVSVPGEFYLDTAAQIVREHFPNSFLACRLGRWSGVYGDPLAVRLTPAQRQVLRYALDGYGAKEIASATGRSVKTIGNQLASLHEAFGVNSTLRLVAECHRRGLGSPRWHELAPAPKPRLAVRRAG